MLPEAQYTALYALACGMTAEEAWREVAQYLPAEAPQEHVDTSDLVAAMEHTPSQVVFLTGHEELQRILAHPFAAWRIFLSPAQRRIAYAPSYTGQAQVTGGAGTGKTVTALHRAAYLADQAHTQLFSAQAEGASPSILLTTFTRNRRRAGRRPDQRTHRSGSTPGADHLTSVREIPGAWSGLATLPEDEV